MGSSGRSSGGGGSSGEVDYPEYQKVVQADWLAGGEYDAPSTMARLDPEKNITAMVNDSVDANPYLDAAAYDPEIMADNMINTIYNYLPRLDQEVDAYLTYIDSYIADLQNDSSLANAETLLNDTDLSSFIETYIRDSAINRLEFIADDFSSNVSPELYYVDGSLDEALAYVRSMDTTEDVENELSRFNSQMREINAVHSSAFAVGNQIIASGLMKTKAQLQTELGKYKSDKMAQYVQLKSTVQSKVADIELNIGQLKNEKAKTIMQMQVDAFKQKIAPALQLAQLGLDKSKVVSEIGTKAHDRVYTTIADAAQSKTRLYLEAYRMILVAYKEEAEENLRIETKAAMWSTDIFQGAANVMASVAGGTVTTPEDSAGKTQSALGGALSGAASGAMIGAQTGNPYGAAIGGVIGGIGGLMAS